MQLLSRHQSKGSTVAQGLENNVITELEV